MTRRLPMTRRIVVTALMALALLAACRPPATPVPPQPPPSTTPSTSCRPLTDDAGVVLFQAELQPGQLFVPGQVVLTGRNQDLAAVVERLPELKLEPLGRPIDLGYLAKLWSPDRQRADAFAAAEQAGPLPWPTYDNLTIQLYGVGSQTPVPQVVEQVYKTAAEQALTVAADPNYVVGFPIVGSPWEIEGSPWEIEGSTGGALEPAKAQPLFWRQWGFLARAGIVPGGGLQPGSRTVSPTGAGIKVAVFDTAPFKASGLQSISWITPTLNLCVTKLLPAVVLTYPGQKLPDVSDHGLFVSGLAFGVAPAAEFHLIEVLNQTGQGDLITLINALNLFVQQHADSSQPLALADTVVNLSLGVPDPAEAGLPPELVDLLRKVLAGLGTGYDPGATGGLPIVSLETLMATLSRLGAVVVAAAGNSSAAAGVALPPQIPAAYPSVIGVAASNNKGQRACYANAGDLAAPGGDGGSGGASSCTPAHNSCPIDDANCPYGVISLVRTGYAYWVGSSFAAPMVSGAAALLLEKGVAPGQVLTTVRTAGPAPDLGKGVINLAAGVP